MSKSNLTYVNDGRTAFSYATAIKDYLPDGRTIGNVTPYSNTTSRHQVKAGSYSCDILITGVPMGISDLPRYWRDSEWEETRPNPKSRPDYVVYRRTGPKLGSYRPERP